MPNSDTQYACKHLMPANVKEVNVILSGGGGYDGITSGNGGNGQGGFVYIWYKI